MAGVRTATEEDTDGLLRLAAEVEQWFGPMVEVPGFRRALGRHLVRGTALVRPGAQQLLGGVLFGPGRPAHLDWLVVTEQARRRGVGRALLAECVRRFVRPPGRIEVVTFGAAHPGAEASGARAFYERLGFSPAEPAPPGPEGGPRQLYRCDVRRP
ncbi:GNAT family N-acetyltransferase [Streptomyces xiaopingdaonensis]|uniref:GNAT family N-acetyltransferase n=1 Tax=Streptomyces xiaopingdaonensis TaxID=1565415 RepID=UPI0003645F62|nr:GNAT family N-acetyltransferase [Streptomyces xiaopingdaonensis]